MERLDNSILSPTQQYIVNKMSTAKRFAVVGGPGTGKTCLAMSAMAKSKSKQVLIVYSKPLTKMIEACSTKALTLHSFCWRFGADMEGVLGRNRDGLTVSEKYGYSKTGWPQWENLNKTYSELDERQKKELRYDAIFIDEGQDLPNEAYEFLNKISERVIVTYDEAQEVGRETSDETTSITRKASVDCNRILRQLDLEETFGDLFENFRNTAQIDCVSKLFYNNYGTSAPSLRLLSGKGKEGVKPKVVFSEVTQEIIDKIAEDAYQMNKLIAIIVPGEKAFYHIKDYMQNSIKSGKISEKKFHYKYGDDENMGKAENLNDTGVFLMTYKSSKGMEFNEVYLFDCQAMRLNTPAEKNKFYVATTRAERGLYLYFDCSRGSNCPVLKKIRENQNLFDIDGGGL